MEAVRDLGALVEAERDHAIRQFMEARDSWVKFLRAPTDRESDEGSKALDRLFGTEGGK